MNHFLRIQWLIAATVAFVIVQPCTAQTTFEFGPLTELRTDEGRLSFGTIVSADVVSWSSPDAQDLLIARLWDGVYLYPSKEATKRDILRFDDG